VPVRVEHDGEKLATLLRNPAGDITFPSNDFPQRISRLRVRASGFRFFAKPNKSRLDSALRAYLKE
jgi:hypothetical protein